MNRQPKTWVLEALLVAVLFSYAFGLFDTYNLHGNGPSLTQKIEVWFFDTSGSSAGLVAAIAAWMAWARLPRLLQIRDARRSSTTPQQIASGLFFLACLATLVWADLNQASDLLFIAIAFLLASCATHLAGMAGLQILGLPILVLCFALPIPYPLNNEILWTLQNESAAGTAKALGLLGVEIHRSGAQLQHGDLFFLVIEGCSGLRSLLTLMLVSLVVRELMGERSLRSWIPVLLAPPLAVILNIVRISVIVLGSSASDPSIGNEHLEQGLAVLAVGSGILFLIGHFLAADAPDSTPRKIDPSDWPLRWLAAALAVLCLAHVSIDPWPTLGTSPDHDTSERINRIHFPPVYRLWHSETMELDYPFLGILPRGDIERRLYHRDRPIDRLGDRSVELLIAASSEAKPRGSPISSKLIAPGRGWQIDESTPEHNYTLGREVTISIASRPESRALVYSWSLHDDGLWRETLRSFLALERGPFARPEPRYMIQLATIIGDEPEAERHAKVVLDRFVEDLRRPLRSL